MARIQKEREGKERKRYYKNAHKFYISHPCSEGLDYAIFTKFGTVVDLTCVMTYANFGWYRLKGGLFAALQNVPFPHDFNGWPYNRQALTCCRDVFSCAPSIHTAQLTSPGYQQNIFLGNVG